MKLCLSHIILRQALFVDAKLLFEGVTNSNTAPPPSPKAFPFLLLLLKCLFHTHLPQLISAEQNPHVCDFCLQEY